MIDTLLPEPGENHLQQALEAAGIECHVIGDAAGVGYIQGAMYGAHGVATTL